MTTRIVASSSNPSDRAFIDRWIGSLLAVIAMCLVFAASYGSAQIQSLREGTLFGHQSAGLIASGFAIGAGIICFVAVQLFNKRYARKSADFFQSIRTRVEKETGEHMTDRQIMSFLAAGKASDNGGNDMKTEYTDEEFRVLLISA